MWLLSTSRAELHEFPSPETVPGGYAILSHVWDAEEQTFQVTQWLRQTCNKTGANPRDSSHPKIRHACILAESHGYDWLWVDTSCIDKSSSADLSEAINSMFRYYSLAKMCYAYLRDCPPATGSESYLSRRRDPMSHRGAFMASKWHTRGWTLQELIASPFVLFLAEDWTHIGTKAELAGLLERTTRIPSNLLRLETRLADYSVAQRMSWAAARQTTRVEDRAYSLLGIFGINMSTLYGEGEQAFYRLQEEIMKRRADTTLFAWSSPSNTLGRPTEDRFLLAPSPGYFRNCGNIIFNKPTFNFQAQWWSANHINLLNHTMALIKVAIPPTTMQTNTEHSETIAFSITPHGVLARIPLLEHWYNDAGYEATAYLFWSDRFGTPMGLRLIRCMTSADASRPHFDVVCGRVYRLSRDAQGRFVDYRHNGTHQVVRLAWKEIYITHRPPPEAAVDEHAGKVFVSMNLGSFVPFRISDMDVNDLPASPLPIELTACTPVSLPWDGYPPVILQFESRSSLRYLAMLHLGRCQLERSEQTTAPAGPGHWAFLRLTTKYLGEYIRTGEDKLEHVCSRHHIQEWPDQTKAFLVRGSGTDDRTAGPRAGDESIILSFRPCPVSPKTTLITHITTRRTSERDVISLPFLQELLPESGLLELPTDHGPQSSSDPTTLLIDDNVISDTAHDVQNLEVPTEGGVEIPRIMVTDVDGSPHSDMSLDSQAVASEVTASPRPPSMSRVSLACELDMGSGDPSIAGEPIAKEDNDSDNVEPREGGRDNDPAETSRYRLQVMESILAELQQAETNPEVQRDGEAVASDSDLEPKRSVECPPLPEAEPPPKGAKKFRFFKLFRGGTSGLVRAQRKTRAWILRGS